jgi:ATP-dependent DNA helicase UvrD/PcrA
VPYRVYGGLRFFERAEIKDALAYLRLLANHDDDGSFERVVNLPPRGIGARTLDGLRETARAAGTSLWSAARSGGGETGARAAGALQAFCTLIEKLAAETAGRPLHEIVDRVIQGSGLVAHYQKERADRGEARVENLDELVSAARGFLPEGDLPPLEGFLAHAVLESGETQAEPFEDCVQMMTLHSAKGLEFPLVLICGMEDGLFPHQRSQSDLEGLEEERRLCYVGMTRAMRQLYLTYAEQRRLHGTDTYNAPSRFIREIPPALLEEVRPRIRVAQHPGAWRDRADQGFHAGEDFAGAQGRSLRGGIARGGFGAVSTGAGAGSSARGAAGGGRLTEALAGGMRLGSRVRHGKFGEGVVLTIEGQGAHARVQVNFERQGSKWLMLQYANLEVM